MKENIMTLKTAYLLVPKLNKRKQLRSKMMGEAYDYTYISGISNIDVTGLQTRLLQKAQLFLSFIVYIRRFDTSLTTD